MSDTAQFTKPGTSPFQEENLTLRGHIDPDKHWIGETLPAASDSEIKPSGVSSSAGHSPFPARADHSHDNKTYYGVYNRVGSLSVPPGNVFISGLNFYSGRNMLAPASTQIILFPIEGIWRSTINMSINRVGGGTFLGEMEVLFYYSNGGTSRGVFRDSMINLPNYKFLTVFDYVHYFTADNTTNVQASIAHNDSATWSVDIGFFQVERVCSTGSA